MAEPPDALVWLVQTVADAVPPFTPDEEARINAWWERMDERRQRDAARTAEEGPDA